VDLERVRSFRGPVKLLYRQWKQTDPTSQLFGGLSLAEQNDLDAQKGRRYLLRR
jgi:hypothetical protein